MLLLNSPPRTTVNCLDLLVRFLFKLWIWSRPTKCWTISWGYSLFTHEMRTLRTSGFWPVSQVIWGPLAGSWWFDECVGGMWIITAMGKRFTLLEKQFHVIFSAFGSPRQTEGTSVSRGGLVVSNGKNRHDRRRDKRWPDRQVVLMVMTSLKSIRVLFRQRRISRAILWQRQRMRS